MEYMKKTFTVPLGGEKYAEGWDRAFGWCLVEDRQPEALVRCPGGHEFWVDPRDEQNLVLDDAKLRARCPACLRVW